MILKIAVCDDEPVICQKLISDLKQMNEGYEIDEFHDGETILQSNNAYDVIFMDIELCGIDGMETVKNMREKGNRSYIIFLTGHMEFVQSAFKVKAFRYLRKPFCKEELKEAITEIEREKQDDMGFYMNSNGKNVLIKQNNIICIEAFGDGTYIYTTDGMYESSYYLKYWTSLLEQQYFFRVHKSFVISVRYVKEVSNNYLVMSQMKNKIPIARRKYKLFQNCFYEYIKKQAKIL